jgi:hypothetical protein
MLLDGDDIAKDFGADIIRDMVKDNPAYYAGWTLDIAEGERCVATLAFPVG